MMDANEKTLLVEREGGKAIVTINRQHVLNALNLETILALDEAMRELNADPSVRVIIITGAGGKAFSAGADIAEQLAMDTLASYEFSQTGNRIFSEIESSPKPVIAAVNGYCLGGGFELMLACDIRICVQSAKLGAPESKLGVMCGFGGNLRLPRIIGKGKAKELLMTGKMIDAQEAWRIGLVNEIVPDGKLMEAVDAMCADLLNKSAISLSLIKRVVDYGMEMDFKSAVQFDTAMFALVASTEDKEEGMRAFLEKRPAVFKDR